MLRASRRVNCHLLETNSSNGSPHTHTPLLLLARDTPRSRGEQRCFESNAPKCCSFFCLPAGTPYDGGSFHIKLVLGNDFPHSPPRGFFLTKIYHPNVAPNGDICVNTLKRDWTAEVTLTHVLQVCTCMLHEIFITCILRTSIDR